ncbi:MAG: hypothetical protein QF721_08550 [Verrucomicrobiota bacterium]|jgi:hypothetical protein|nr:hypothetical protein [Verrucomicrobiota bacterium]
MRQSIQLTKRCLLLGALALGQSALAGWVAYNDFGSPSHRDKSITRIGATSAELKAGTGSVLKTGKLIDFATGQSERVQLKLTVTGSPSSQSEVGNDAPATTEAGAVFGDRVNCSGGTSLPTGKVHFIDLSGLDPSRHYELVLFASNPAGGTAKPISFTLWDISSFENRSVVAPGRVTIDGQFNRTTTIETTGNDSAVRGNVCRYEFIRTGNDGDLRVILQSPNGGQLNALMLREQTPPVLAAKPVVALGEDHAVINGTIADPANGAIELRWREAGSEAAWQTKALTPNEDSAVVARLNSLAVFVDHEFVFVQKTDDGEIVSEAQIIRPQKLGVIYSTGFEPTEPVAFLPGAITAKTGPWRVAKGNAEVQTSRVAHGGQAVRTGDCVIEMTLENPEPVLWADAFIQDPGISQARRIPDGKASSVLLFHDGKLLALDGNGSGGGSFVTAGELQGDRFTRLTIRSDYGARQFDVWVDGKPALAKLGFKDNSVTRFHGAKRLAGANSYLDDFSLSTWGLDRDSDGDGMNDLDEAKFYGSYPLLADSDRDGASDAHEIAAGTHPADPGSIFAVKIGTAADGKTKLSIPTLTGLEYTLQRRAALAQGRWRSVPGFENMPGDGSVQSFLETPDGRNYFYRGVIVNRLNP